MSVLLWIIVGAIAAIVINTLRGHNTALNTIAALVGSIGSGLTYILATVGNGSIWDAVTNTNWASFWVSVVGAIVFVTVAQLYTLEAKEYDDYQDKLTH